MVAPVVAIFRATKRAAGSEPEASVGEDLGRNTQQDPSDSVEEGDDSASRRMDGGTVAQI
ncbi:hypothetical protein K443DRAFT_11757 [Laccaria amethystina LaAM-08-1]|uniref:Unplaced genomic scaffold K443scaffold_240, whole genome shotgun sequence n=1 Tax=Laccaria amethystina LaAM-08-1 TaxID=1095629 RepID=A0A0C9WJL0_9AGAR|nr:hypothetical protein K443DRAFT_11757 [Laccaria amethystina LaAM-08-1]